MSHIVDNSSTPISPMPSPRVPTHDELRAWSRYIRDVLRSKVAVKDEVVLSSTIIDEGEEFMNLLDRATIDVESLRFSRVHFALYEISATGSRWPLKIVLKAESLLALWEAELGPLKEIRADLWGAGGRLEGLPKLNDSSMTWSNQVSKRDSLAAFTVVKSKNLRSAWPVDRLKGPYHSMIAGHDGFSIGDWWIKRAAAHRDGIIDGSAHGITADKDGAYAILMTGEEELETATENLVKYRTSQFDPGCFKLMENLSSRQVVRVLRSWRMSSKWKPKAGLRYDGLYRVSGYSVKLASNAIGNDEWLYTFTLERQEGQPSMDKALCHPTADEMDDWNDYSLLAGINNDSAD